MNFFSVLRSNLKCAFCKEKRCPVRFYPERKHYQFLNGTRFIMSCKKDREKRFNEALKKKFP